MIEYLNELPRCWFLGCAVTLLAILIAYSRMKREKKDFDEYRKSRRK